MKIAFFTSTFPILSEGFVINQIAGLMTNLHDVRIYARKRPPNIPEPPAVNQWKMRTYARMIKVRPTHAKIMKKYIGSTFAQRLIMAHVKWITHSAYPTSNMSLVESWRYHILYGQFGDTGSYALALRDTGILQGAVVTAFRGIDVTQRPLEHGPDVYTDLFARSQLCMPCCQYFAQRLRELGCPPEKIRVHYSGIVPEKFHMAERNYHQRPFHFLSLCRLTPKKGLAHSLQSFARLIGKGYQDVIYTVAGDGPEREALEQLTAELGIKRHVTFTGRLAHEEIQNTLAQAHVFVAASVTPPSGDQDGDANSVKEASASGLPVIVSRHGGLPELVEPDSTGLIVQENDMEELASAMECLYRNSDMCRNMGKRGPIWISKRFNSDELNRELIAILEGVSHSYVKSSS